MTTPHQSQPNQPTELQTPRTDAVENHIEATEPTRLACYRALLEWTKQLERENKKLKELSPKLADYIQLESKLQQCEKERDEFKHGWQVANELHEQDHGHLNELLEVINGDASIGVNEALRKLKARDNECIQAADDMAQLQYKFSHLTAIAKQLVEALQVYADGNRWNMIYDRFGELK